MLKNAVAAAKKETKRLEAQNTSLAQQVALMEHIIRSHSLSYAAISIADTITVVIHRCSYSRRRCECGKMSRPFGVNRSTGMVKL
jgi:hypothetical protein